jgi:O-antigen/teichoic acid export membrane protein
MTRDPTPDSSVPAPRSWAREWMSDSAQLLASQVLTVVATSVAAITIARTLAPGDWAVFSALLGLSVALTLVADFGIGTWLLRELSSSLADKEPKPPEHLSRLLGAGVLVNVVVALPLLVGALVWSIVGRPGVDVVIALISLLLYGMLVASSNALEALLRAQRRVRLVLSASLVEKGVLVALLLSVAATDAGLAAIGFAYLVAGLTRVAFNGVVVFARDRLPLPRPSARAARETARASLPFALNAASLNLIPRLDMLVLVALSTTSAAWFAIGDRLLGPALIIPATLGSALYPFMATRAAKHASPWVIAGGLGLVGLAIAAAGVLLAPFLVPLVFGSEYEDAVPVVQVMLLGIPFVYATGPLLVVAYSHRRERLLLVPVLGISFIGTLAIVVGQALGGAVAAGAGVVVRFALVLVATAAVSFVAWRGHMRESAGSSLPATRQATAQTP